MLLNNFHQLEQDCLAVSKELRVISVSLNNRLDVLLLGASLGMSPVIYFSTPHQVVEYLAVGAWSILSMADAQQMTHDYDDICCFGANSFFSGEDSEEYWVLPNIWLEQTDDECVLHVVMDCLNRSSHDAWAVVSPILHALCHDPLVTQDLTAYQSMVHLPNNNDWHALIDSAKKNLESDALGKVVLARKTTFLFQSTINPFLMLRRIQAADDGVINFCIKFNKDRSFIGGTPERLFEMNGRTIISDAIAGTMFKSMDADVSKLTRDLLSSCKNVEEHQFVVDAIKRAFSELCITWHMDDSLSVVELAYLIHLLTHFEGVLKDSHDWRMVLETLHPTPAVSGYPITDAVSFIQQKEPFDRGFYSGPMGIVSNQYAYIVVAIRSGMVRRQSVELIAGAGIVSESDAQEEWEELNAKINLFKVVFDEGRL